MLSFRFNQLIVITYFYLSHCDAFHPPSGQSNGFAPLLYSFFLLSNCLPTVTPDLSRDKWCPWSAWSRCAPLSCHNRVNFFADFPDKIGEVLDDEDERGEAYCVVQPTATSKKVIWTAVVQYVRDGMTRTRTPFKKRTRMCRCPSYSILNVFDFMRKDQCLRGSEETQCVMCNPDEPIYSDFESSKLLPFCDPFDYGSFHLYKILGGVAGCILIALVLVWFVRTLCKAISRTGRTTHRRSTGRGRSQSTDQEFSGWAPTDACQNPLSRRRPVPSDNDSPPAYKDVVSSGVQFLPASGVPPGFIHKSITPSAPPSNLTASSGQHDLGEPGSSTPPPPSYEEVMSGCRIPLTDIADPQMPTENNQDVPPSPSDSQC